jgi:hypothetical protein
MEDSKQHLHNVKKPVPEMGTGFSIGDNDLNNWDSE